jgi:hypothetical protein
MTRFAILATLIAICGFATNARVPATHSTEDVMMAKKRSKRVARNKMLLSAFTLQMLCAAPALAASSKIITAVTCEGETASAHTLIGNCSFMGPPAGQVYATCKEDSKCYVAGPWMEQRNGHGLFIITSVESVKRTSRPESVLNPEELEMARECQRGKPCSLT